MAEQIARFQEIVQRPNVELQVLPFGHGFHYGLNGAFQLLRLPVDAVEDTVYVDGLIGQFFFDSTKQIERYERYFTSLWRPSGGQADEITEQLLDQGARRWKG
jgi:hypothetical protein